jgi:hypothetical protein
MQDATMMEETMALEPETKAELSKAGARVVATTGAPSRELYERQVGGNGQQHRAAMIASLEAMQARSHDNWAQLIATIRAFVTEQRGELDRLERWLGTK